MVSLGSKVSFATINLNYPIFSAEFDPYGRGYLVVGGGGGESQTGVPNRISVLDVSNRATIESVVDVELSTHEDSVQSLGSLATKDGLITLAGINSSQADQDAGRNEHFRAFDIKLPPRKRQKMQNEENEKGSATLIGKRSIFKPERSSKKEAYQRLLRLSPAQKKESGSKRIGAVVSAMSKPAEIVVFSATTALPTPTDILARIEAEATDEVSDLDIVVADEDRFSVAWCTDYAIYEQTMEYDFDSKKVQKTPKGPRRIHQVPQAVGETTSTRAKFRCLRFLDAENVLALVNRPNKKGAELHVYHLYPTGPAATVLQMTLPAHIKQAVSMDVCILDSDSNGNRQVAIAVAGQDVSIETYVLNYRAASGTFSRFHAFQTFRDVHKQQMTKICFAPFHAPATGNKSEQFIRLASVSYGNTVVVDALPLSLLSLKGQSRYVLVHPATQARLQYLYIALISFMIIVAAYLGQAYLRGEADIRTDFHNFWTDTFQEVFNQTSSSVQDVSQQMSASAASIVDGAIPSEASSRVATGVESLVPTHASSSVASVLESLVPTDASSSIASVVESIVPTDVQSTVASVVQSTLPTALPSLHSLQELLNLHSDESKAVVISDGDLDNGVAFNVHHDKEQFLAQDRDAKQWDELKPEQKHYWKEKLLNAGHWAESEGETVLKGVLWNQYAGLVGAAAGEVLREL